MVTPCSRASVTSVLLAFCFSFSAVLSITVASISVDTTTTSPSFQLYIISSHEHISGRTHRIMEAKNMSMALVVFRMLA